MSAEAMAEQSRRRAEELAETLQEQAVGLAVAAEVQESALQERERQLHEMVEEQVEAVGLLNEAEVRAAVFEADLIQEEVNKAKAEREEAAAARLNAREQAMEEVLIFFVSHQLKS